MPNAFVVLIAFLFLFAQAFEAHANDESSVHQKIAEMSLDELFALEVQTASRFEDSPLNVASSVSKVTEDEWQSRGARRTLDAIRSVPGVYVQESFVGSTVPAFRGFLGNNSYTGYSLQLDGIPLNTYSFQSPSYAYLDIPLDSLSSIEVIRGPGSAIYGTDSFNGTVALKSWSPDEDIIEGRVSAGTFEYHTESARMRKSLADDLALTLIASHTNLSDRDQEYNYTESVSLEPKTASAENAFYSQSYIMKLNLRDLELAYYFIEGRRREVTSQPEVLSQGVPNGALSRARSEAHVLRASYDAELTDELILETTASHLSADFSAFTDSFGPGNVQAGQPIGEFRGLQDDERSMLDVALKKPFGETQLQALLGYTFDYANNIDFAPGFEENRSNPGAGKSRRVHGVYAQFEYDAWDRFVRFVAGGRFDHYSDFGDQLTPRAGIILHPDESSALKFLYGRAFRAPGLSEQLGVPPVLQGGGDSLQPEIVDTYELVWMNANHNFSYGITGFYNELNDSIVIGPAQSGSGAPLGWQNAGEANSYGVEFESQLNLSHTQLNFNYTYAHAHSSTSHGGEDTYRAFPSHILHSSVTHRITDRLRVALHNTNYFSHQSLRTLDSADTYSNEPLPSFWRTDFYTGYSLDEFGDKLGADLEAFLFLEDIFDRKDVSAGVGPERGQYGAGFAVIAGLKGSWR